MDNAVQKELEDKVLKARNAREAAGAPGASARDKADHKLREQELIAEQHKARRQARQGYQKVEPDKPSRLEDRLEKKLDAALKDSFPGSDPVSFVEAGPVRKGDHDLTVVKVNKQKADEADKRK